MRRLLSPFFRLLRFFPMWMTRLLFWAAGQKFVVGAALIVMNPTQEVLFFHHTYRNKRSEWSLPGGWMKLGETPEEGLAREVFEESRLRVKVTKLLSLRVSDRFPRYDLIYLGELEGGEFKPSDEVDQFRFIPLAELPELLPAARQAVQDAAREIAAREVAARAESQPGKMEAP